MTLPSAVNEEALQGYFVSAGEEAQGSVLTTTWTDCNDWLEEMLQSTEHLEARAVPLGHRLNRKSPSSALLLRHLYAL